MTGLLERMIDGARRRRWVHLAVVNLRILIGFGFLPAGLKKVLDQPFTDPGNQGRFHDFLHAFHASGAFYQFVGVVQLTAATLLMTQRFATLGAVIALPVLAAITAFCWSTGVVPTAIVATLMLSGTIGLLLWDLDRWRGVLGGAPAPPAAPPAPIDLRLWQAAGAVVLALYVGATAFTGAIYRPRGVELDEPAFYLLVVIPLVPLAALIAERRRRRG